jgi:FkbM family methyltransferase
MSVNDAIRHLLNVAVPLRARNSIRLTLHRHPIERRLRWADLAMLRIGKGDVVFDVGANVGDFTECVLAHQPWAVVHAFEPLPDVYKTLCARFKDYPGIYCRNVALGGEAGEAAINVSNFHEASSFLENGQLLDEKVYGIDFTVREVVAVPVETVAKYVSARGLGNIKLLKLDVQGYELEVLKGAEPVFNRVEYIYVEAQFQELYKGGPLYSDIFEFLNQRGFDLLRMTAFRTDDGGRLMECDMIFKNRAIQSHPGLFANAR